MKAPLTLTRAQILAFRRRVSALDERLPYETMHSLSLEARQKLAHLRPRTLAQAAGVPGVSPTDLQNLVIEIEKRRRAASGEAASGR